MTAKRNSYYASHRRTRRPRPESQAAAERRKFSESIGGIDKDIQQTFLTLPTDKLNEVFRRYGQEFGKGALSYAKQTYPNWQSGRVNMSGAVSLRLLNFVPVVLEAETRFEWVKKLRRLYMHKELKQVSCTPSDWFKKVVPVVNELVERSNSFELPPEIVSQVNWVVEGDALAAQQLLAAAEMDEANERTKYLAAEFDRIGRLLENLKEQTSFTQKIELPQGTIVVEIDLPKTGLLQWLTLSTAGGVEDIRDRKRPLFVTCKNSQCGVRLKTNLTGYDGEPIACTPGSITCQRCRETHIYDGCDLHVTYECGRVKLQPKLFGGYDIAYDCPHCETRLKSPIDEAGMSDTCPKCRQSFIVPLAVLSQK